ncbi:MAG TPA: hypothetical protein PKE30_00730 [Niabella sp.]|nr:hypothetical protein [Niabella sp.]
MNCITRFLLLAAIIFNLQTYAQSKYLKRDSSIPDISFSDVLNYKSGVLNFNDFKSKFIILDFWNTACISCIKSFPLIDSLQKVYAGKIQFILANRESLDSTIRFFKERKFIKMPQIPMITGSKKLSDMFDINSYPYTVWIDDLGKIKHFISSYNISKQNLDDLIAGKKVSAKQLDKPVFRGDYFDADRPDSLKSRLQYYCYISRYSDAINIGNSERGSINDSTIRLAYYRQSIVDLYKRAYKEHNRYKFDHPESVVLLVKDTTKYIRPINTYERDTWYLNNGYTFDMVLPVLKRDDAYKIMQQQLHNYFGLKARVFKEYKDGVLLDVLEIKE